PLVEVRGGDRAGVPRRALPQQHACGGRHDDDALLPLIFQHVLDLPYRALDVPHGRRVPRRRPRRGQQHVPRQGAVAGGAPLQRQE
ncbi:5'-cyclic nucleotide phosphodiesterase 1B (Cam-PDE 1B) (Fragment), partial [Durusdinium trenchii]